MHADYFNDYTAVLIASVAGVILVLTAFVGSLLLSPRARSALKDIPYECGIEPVGDQWSQMHFRYYPFAILFLIFAVEAVFLFPWAVVFLSPFLTSAIFYEMLIFIGILGFGLLYSWKKGVLDWR